MLLPDIANWIYVNNPIVAYGCQHSTPLKSRAPVGSEPRGTEPIFYSVGAVQPDALGESKSPGKHYALCDYSPSVPLSMRSNGHYGKASRIKALWRIQGNCSGLPVTVLNG